MSNLIKSFSYKTLTDRHQIEILDTHLIAEKVNSQLEANEDKVSPLAQAEQETAELRKQLLQDAEEMAERRIQEAQTEANELLAKARQEIDEWWQSQRALDEETTANAHQAGFDKGFEEGKLAGERAAQEQYAAKLAEAEQILQLAHQQKHMIIGEAEPFLVELSCEIAKKIIGKQLTLSPEWIIEMTRTVLARRGEQRLITLCVSPKHYALIMDAKEELRQVIDSQAELVITADNTVQDDGCIIRTEYGSLDARIDTQLTEIRNVLLQLTESEAEYERV